MLYLRKLNAIKTDEKHSFYAVFPIFVLLYHIPLFFSQFRLLSYIHFSFYKRPLCVKGAVTVGDWGIVFLQSFHRKRSPSLCTREALFLKLQIVMLVFVLKNFLFHFLSENCICLFDILWMSFRPAFQHIISLLTSTKCQQRKEDNICLLIKTATAQTISAERKLRKWE